MRNLKDKLGNFEMVCGSGIIHDVRLHLNLMVNWERNLEYYSNKDVQFKMFDWDRRNADGSIPMFEPDQGYVDKYFSDICNKAEKFLISNVRKKGD